MTRRRPAGPTGRPGGGPARRLQQVYPLPLAVRLRRTRTKDSLGHGGVARVVTVTVTVGVAGAPAWTVTLARGSGLGTRHGTGGRRFSESRRPSFSESWHLEPEPGVTPSHRDRHGVTVTR